MGMSDEPTFHGVASAIYSPKGQMHMSITRLSGVNKDAIFVDETHSEPIDVGSVESIRAAFDRLFSATVAAVQDQQTQGLNVPVPVIYGWPQSFEMDNLEVFGENFRTAFRSIFSGIPSYGANDELSQKAPYYRGWPGSVMWSHLVSKGLSKELIKPEIHTLFAPESMPPNLGEVDPQLEAGIKMLVDMANAGNEDVKSILLNIIQDMAKSHAAFYKKAGHTGGSFFMVAPPRPELKGKLAWNLPGLNDEFRECYAQALIQELNLDRSITVKVPDDESSSPFADPVATKMADLMSLHHDGVLKPSCVLVKNK